MKTYKFTINGNKYTVDVSDIQDNKVEVEVNNTPYTVELDMPLQESVSKPQVKTVKVAAPPTPKAGTADATVAPAPAAKSEGSAVKSPLPGTILEIHVKEGDVVKAGQHLMMLEAMKMENNIDADREGTVTAIKVRIGESVMEGDVLIMIS